MFGESGWIKVLVEKSLANWSVVILMIMDGTAHDVCV